MDAKEYEGLSRSQAAKFRAYYENEYTSLFPAPELKIIGLDWKFYGLTITSISTVLVAALRTAQMFYFAEELSSRFWTKSETGNPWIGSAGALFSMLAFEGGVALISAIKTSEKEKVENWVYNTQIGLLLIISVFAGFGQSLGLVQGISEKFLQNFSYFLVFVVGVGASFAAWFSGEILGVQLQKFSTKKAEAEEKFLEQKRIHVQNARKKFLERTENEKLENRISPRTSVRREVETSVRTARTSPGTSEKVSLIYGELERAGREEKRLLPFAELAKLLRERYPEQNFSSDGYISTKRNLWISSHPEYFGNSPKEEGQNESQ